MLPLVTLPIVALLTASLLPPWAFMWTMAFALYAGCKWLTYRQAGPERALWSLASRGARPERAFWSRASRRARPERAFWSRASRRARPERAFWSRASRGIASDTRSHTLGYLLAWPGMDANAFLGGSDSVARPSPSEWIAAAGKTVLGVLVTWVVARAAWPAHPLVTGWIGMIGAILVLHFGSFHLVSLYWRRAGVNALPVMRNPIRSTSLGEFWGRRWNTAFHELASRFAFRPLSVTLGTAGASLLTFVVSGLIHELVITVPARAAYGLPTGYFVLQGLGIASERSSWGRHIGLGKGLRGRVFTILVVAGPACLLFPPPFVHRVILPMLRVIGAV